MHNSSLLRMKYFIREFCEPYDSKGRKRRVLDVGSYDVNGTYKNLFLEAGLEYVGLDVSEGPNVDVVPNNMYDWGDIQDESFDYVVSGQAFEHIEYPWLTIGEMKKKLKENGIICILAPNGMGEHRYPIDCWRFFGDGMKALAKWCGLETIEVSVGGVPDKYCPKEFDDVCNDVCLVACKSVCIKDRYRNKRMFPVERRYDEYGDLKLQHEFLGKWICDENRMNRLITEYITRNQYSLVLIDGEGYLAAALKTLLTRKGIEYESADRKCEIQEKNPEKFWNILYIVTEIDTHRVAVTRIKRIMNDTAVKYLDDIVREEAIHQQVEEYRRQFEDCEDVYIYGAGGNGRTIREVFEEEKFPFSGYVVSDGRKNLCSDGGVVMELSEISKECGIIVSPFDNKEIYSILKQRGFNHIADGLSIVKESSLLAKRS